MRAVFPVFLVIIGLGVSEFAESRLPSGLANADRHDLVYLARAGVITAFDHAPPQMQRFLQGVFSNGRVQRDSRSVHGRRHRHSQRRVHSSHGETIRTRLRLGDERVSFYRREQPVGRRDGDQRNGRLRTFGQRDHGSNSDQLVEILFVVPAEKMNESETGRRGRGSRKKY